VPARPARRNRGIWWILGIIAIIIVIGSCAWLGSLGGTGDLTASGDRIAVIPINGVIAGTGSAAGGVITPQGFRDQLKQAVEDDSVKAVVLRVDSPGGTVAASEEISLYVKQCKKPVVVSVGDVDASGAYMVSSQADKIFALPGSAVGSIGVITEIPNVSGLLTKLGIKFTVITAGKYKDAGSPYRALKPSETALIQGQVNEVYGQFIDIVASGRGLKRAEVEKLATGWAWNGTQAKKLGLIDEIGTYTDALDAAAKLGGVTDGYDTVSYNSSSINDLLGGLLGLERQLGKLGASDPRSPDSLGPVIAK
jgi:protease-4